MSKVIENYLLQEVIGSGQFGKVYKGMHIKTEQIFAVKTIKLEKFKVVPKLHEFMVNEIQTLAKISNQNIIKFIEMLRTQNNVYLVYEYCNGGTLEDIIKKKKVLSEKEALQIFAQIQNGFKSLFQNNILHRDLKPSNILVNDGVIKIADFGFCKTLLNDKDMTQTMVGSPLYMAPEILKGYTYSKKADIWSMGVVLYEMLFGVCPYEDRTICRLVNKIDSKPLSFPKHINNVSARTEKLLQMMLQVDPKKRIPWNDLLNYKIFEEDQNPQPSQTNQQIAQQVQLISSEESQNGNQTLPKNAQHNDEKENKQQRPILLTKAKSIQVETIPKDNSLESTNDNSTTQVLKETDENMQKAPAQQETAKVVKKHAQQNQQQTQQQLLQQQRNEQIQQSQSMKYLIKERNKILYQVRVLNQLLDMNDNDLNPIISFMLVKNILLMYQKLCNQILNEECLNKNFSKENFKASPEYPIFLGIFQKEIAHIQVYLQSFRNEFSKIYENNSETPEVEHISSEIHAETINKEYYKNIGIKYIEQLTEQLKKSQDQTEIHKILVHQNEILDCIMLEEWFDSNSNDGMKLNENLQKSDKQYLQELLNYKLNYAKSKLSVNRTQSNNSTTTNTDSNNQLLEVNMA